MTSPDSTPETAGSSSSDDLEPVLDPEQALDAAAESVDAGDEHLEVVQETAARDLGDDPDDAALPSAAPRSDKTASAGPPKKQPGEKVLPPKAKAKAKAQQPGRVTPKAADLPPSARPAGSAQGYRPPSPVWVPIAMFGLWGFGLLIIILNYMDVLPGTGDGGNGWYLIAGLVAILGGIVAATKYH